MNKLIMSKPDEDWGVDMWSAYLKALHNPSRMPELMQIYERYIDDVRETNYRNNLDAYVALREQETIEERSELEVFDFYLNKYMFFRIVEFDGNGNVKRIASYNSPIEEVW